MPAFIFLANRRYDLCLLIVIWCWPAFAFMAVLHSLMLSSNQKSILSLQESQFWKTKNKRLKLDGSSRHPWVLWRCMVHCIRILVTVACIDNVYSTTHDKLQPANAVFFTNININIHFPIHGVRIQWSRPVWKHTTACVVKQPAHNSTTRTHLTVIANAGCAQLLHPLSTTFSSSCVRRLVHWNWLHCVELRASTRFTNHSSSSACQNYPSENTIETMSWIISQRSVVYWF